MADIDGDGRLDVVTGSDDCCDREPGFHWFRREADGRFTAMPEVLVRVADVPAREWSPIRRFRMRVALADWDGDGRLDLLATDTRSPGGLHRTRGPWSPKAESIGAVAEIAGSPPSSSMLAQPVLVDWDRDGRLDLISADSEPIQSPQPSITYRIWWSRNEGPPASPRLGPRQELLKLDDEQLEGLNAADWDGDGWPDLLVASREFPWLSTRREFRTRLWIYPRRNGVQQSLAEAPGPHQARPTR